MFGNTPASDGGGHWSREVSRPQLRSQAQNAALVHPSFRRLPPPIITIGMHRSGTSVVTAVLAALGVYMGKRLLPLSHGDGFPNGSAREPWPDHAEEHEFWRLNEALLRRAGARWDDVVPYLERRDNRSFHAAAVRRLQLATFGSLRWSFLRYMPRDHGGPWGWKDPRSSVTLPHWLRLFPDARIVHVRRDAAAVVASLQRRAVEWQAPSAARPPFVARLQAALCDPVPVATQMVSRLVIPRREASTAPCVDPAYGQDLSRLYENQCLLLRERAAAYIEVRYEELLEDPRSVIAALAGFVGPTADSARVDRAAALVRPSS